MLVGALRLVLEIPGAFSLKEKRRVRAKVVDRIRSRFGVSVAEVEDLDAHSRLVIGVSAVGNDRRVLESLLSKVTDHVDSLGVARIIGEDWEISPFPSSPVLTWQD
ncbi:MAG TPA: DUF503 domain-containing protein [Myxococcota bacterium]|nr:DUF503 domain-containing protein [Myxococcota bacterium]